MVSSSRFVAGVVLAIVCSSLVSAQTRDLQAVNVISQTSISWNRSVTGGDPLAKLQFNDSRLANTAGGLDPSQVSLRDHCRVAKRLACVVNVPWMSQTTDLKTAKSKECLQHCNMLLQYQFICTQL